MLTFVSRPNISLSASSSVLELSSAHIPYAPPHPQKGTPYHRYVVLLLPQSGVERIKVSRLTEAERLGFNFRSFTEQYGLHGSQGGGAHMWREVWDPTVSHIYKETFSKLSPPSTPHDLLMARTFQNARNLSLVGCKSQTHTPRSSRLQNTSKLSSLLSDALRSCIMLLAWSNMNGLN